MVIGIPCGSLNSFNGSFPFWLIFLGAGANSTVGPFQIPLRRRWTAIAPPNEEPEDF
jgi:hypothetical protein